MSLFATDIGEDHQRPGPAEASAEWTEQAVSAGGSTSRTKTPHHKEGPAGHETSGPFHFVSASARNYCTLWPLRPLWFGGASKVPNAAGSERFRSTPPLCTRLKPRLGSAGRTRPTLLLRLPTARSPDSAAATSSSLAPAKASITRTLASLASVLVPARRRRSVLDRQRRQLLPGRADLYGRVHLRRRAYGKPFKPVRLARVFDGFNALLSS